jgi:hypothetical protein
MGTMCRHCVAAPTALHLSRLTLRSVHLPSLCFCVHAPNCIEDIAPGDGCHSKMSCCFMASSGLPPTSIAPPRVSSSPMPIFRQRRTSSPPRTPRRQPTDNDDNRASTSPRNRPTNSTQPPPRSQREPTDSDELETVAYITRSDGTTMMIQSPRHRRVDSRQLLRATREFLGEESENDEDSETDFWVGRREVNSPPRRSTRRPSTQSRSSGSPSSSTVPRAHSPTATVERLSSLSLTPARNSRPYYNDWPKGPGTTWGEMDEQ